MYIKRVVLEQLRGFDRLDFDLERRSGPSPYAGWTVVTGDNASGKTSFLKAMALALIGPESARGLQPSFKGWIKEGASESMVAVQLVPEEGDRPVTGQPYVKPFWSELCLKRGEGPEVALSPGHKLAPKTRKAPIHGPWAESPSGWFAVGYGPFRRLYGASSDAQRIMSGPPKLARFATMFREDATLGECELWLKDLHHKKLEGRARERAMLEQVIEILNDDFMRNDFRVGRVDSDGLWLKGRDGSVLPLADMSEGYRAALAMLIDIVRFMIGAYGHEDLLESRDGAVAVRHTGVVLIDEVDAHLHPEWQRQIGFWLKQRFPYVQFIVTSHSPLICQAADVDGLFHLPAPGSGQEPYKLEEADYRRVIASKPDVILLSPAFGLKHTRSPQAVAAREESSRLRAKAAAVPLTAAERARMKQLDLFIADE